MSESRWIRRWNTWIASRPAKAGIWRRKEGGFLIRGRTTDPRSGSKKEIRIVLPEATLDAAVERLHAEQTKIREGNTSAPSSLPLWSDYAVSLLEAKVADGSIKARHSRDNWTSTLEQHLIPAFGHFRVDTIRRTDVIGFKNKLAALVKRGIYSPVTANNFLRLFGTITNAAFDEFEIDRRSPGTNLPYLDTSEHVTYTEEEPNSLTAEEMRAFLLLMRVHWPQHFAMITLGFATGQRPSSLRPLRRSGPSADIKWEKALLLIRRSHTYGDEVMNTTKTGIRYSIPLPPDMMDILRWHVAELPKGPMAESELLFPSSTGSFRSTTCLLKPFADIEKRMKLSKHITPRAMRRSFQDMARGLRVHDAVTRAVSGHATEEMQLHYSTAQVGEMRSALAQVVSLAGFREALAAQESGLSGMQSGMHDPSNEKDRSAASG